MTMTTLQKNRIEMLTGLVEKLYRENNLGANSWASWAYDNHVIPVMEHAKFYCDRWAEISEESVSSILAGALLHDIADAVMERSDRRYEETSISMARELLDRIGFNDGQICFMLEGIIAPHTYQEFRPRTEEGRILSTAIALAHFTTDFYIKLCWEHWGKTGKVNDLKEFKAWAIKKIEWDFREKMFFPDAQEIARPRYIALYELYSK